MVLRCTVCKGYFDSQWIGDSLQTICDPCWKKEFPSTAKVIPFRKPA